MLQAFPFVSSLRGYNKRKFSSDLSAGLTVGALLVPQGMAYAMIAGLPPVYGLYAAIFPQLIYTLFGTSRQLSVGPVAMDSLLVATSISTLAEIGSEYYISLAIMMAAIMGMVQLIMGMMRLGFLVNFMSRPVMSGFTSAAALIIGFSQLRHLLDLDIPRSKYIHEIMHYALIHIAYIGWLNFWIGIFGIVFILMLKKYDQRFPAGIVLIILTTVLTYYLSSYEIVLPHIGVIPTGLPSFQLPQITVQLLRSMSPMATTIALIAFIEAYSVSFAIQRKHSSDYQILPNRELIALGLANIISSAMHCYPTSGGFGRSAVNDNAGAQTVVASWISAAFVLITLLFLTPIFFYLPKVTLASLIMVAVWGLVDYTLPRQLWRVDKSDLAMLLASFLGTLILGIEKGIAIGVGLSLVTLIYKTSEPHTAWLGKVQGTNYYRNLMRYKDAIDLPTVSILRFDARLYFANVNALKLKIEEEINRKPSLQTLILDAQSISDIDSTGLSGLLEIKDMLDKSGINFKMVSLIGPVRDKLERAGVRKALGSDNFAPSIDDALGTTTSKLRFQTEDT